MGEYSKEQVLAYYKMMENYDNDYVLNKFSNRIPKGSKVLELGFGTGQDYLQLKADYNMTGSDYSDEFIAAFEQLYDEQILKVNAVKMDVLGKYDCIYSSKVLNSLAEQDIITSLVNQYQTLNDGGYIFHTLWYGDKSVDESFIDKSILQKILGLEFDYVEFQYYKEADFVQTEFDSVIVIARKLSNLNLKYNN